MRTERAHELLAASYGDVTSTGRVLASGRETSSAQEIKDWGSAETPTRTRDYHNNHMNSDKFDMCYVPREGDIVIDTSYKSGTTWTQTICAMLLNKGNVPGWDDEDFPGVMELSPWVDMRIPPPAVTLQVLSGQTERRFLKSHLPLDGLPYFPQVKYVLLVRDLRDVAYSWYNHWYVCVYIYIYIYMVCLCIQCKV